MQKTCKIKTKVVNNNNDSFLLSNRSENGIQKDYFSHEQIVRTLSDIVLSETPPLTVGLFSEWGSGKTVIVNELTNRLEENKVNYVLLDLWNVKPEEFREYFLESINEKLKLGIRKEILGFKKIKLTNFSIKESSIAFLIIILFFAVPYAAKSFFASLDIHFQGVVLDILQGVYYSLPAVVFTQAVLQKNILNIFDSEHIAIKSRREYLNKFKEDILNHPNFQKGKLVVVLDNLDRSEPKVVLEVLSEIKTFLETKEIIYIIPADYQSLIKYIKRDSELIKEEAKANEYLSKVFDVRLDIQRISAEESDCFIKDSIHKSHLLDVVQDRDVCDELLTQMITNVTKGNPRKVIEILNEIIIKLRISKNAENDQVLYKFVSGNIPFLTKVTVLDIYTPAFMEKVRRDRSLFGGVVDFATGKVSISEFQNELGEINKKGVKIQESYKSAKEESLKNGLNFDNFLSDSLAVTEDLIEPFIFLKDNKGTKVFGEKYFSIEADIYEGNIQNIQGHLVIKEQTDDVLTSIDTILKESFSNQRDTEGVYEAVSELWGVLDKENQKHQLFSSYLRGLGSRDESYYSRINLENTFEMIENIKHSQLSTEEKTRNVIQRIIKLGFNGVIKSEDFFSVLTKYGDRAVMEPFLNSIQGNLTEILTKKYTPSIEPNPEGEGKVHDDCGIENEYIKLITKKPNVAALFIPSVDTLLVQFIKENIQALDFMEKWKLLFFLIKHGKVNSELLTTNVIIPGLERFKNENSLEFVREILIDQGVCNFLPKGDVGNVLTRIFEIMKDKIYEKDFNLHKSLCRRYVEKIDQEEVSLSQSYGDYFFELSSDKIESLTAILLDPLAKQEEHKKAFLETVVNKSKQALVSFAGTGGPSADSDKVIMLLKQLSKLAGENLLYENLIENIVSKNYNYVKAIMSNYFESVDPRDWSKLQGVLNAIPSEDITQGGAIDVLLILLCKGKKKIRDTAFRRILDEISNPNIVIKSREVFKELQQNYKLDLMKSLLESLTREGFDYNHAKEHLNFLNENIKFAELNDLWTWIDTKVSTGHGLPTDIIPGIIKIIRNSTSLFEEEDKKDKLIFIVLNLLRVSVSNPTDHLASIREALLLYEDTDHRRTPAKQLRASLELLVESPEELYRNFYETEIKEKL